VIQALIPALAPIIGDVVKSVFPDKDKAREVESALIIKLNENATQLNIAAADIIKAEAQSESWLARNWRPMVMVVFAGLIVARWFGWAAPNLTEAEYLKLWSIVEFGLGGYVVGRSVEKIAPSIADAFRK
jgi:tRNA threonylcarbamoyladenosine modification (KEOPS) complex  Pcc1 subunit